jgi:D-alanyl-D-alanine carboxypeptidase (penicillin-binding protein 5/6)
MARWAMASPGFAALVGTRIRTIRLPNGHTVRLENLNDLLFTDPSVTGVKTGYTTSSHWSLAVTASRGGHRLVAVVIGAPGHPFADGERLLGYGFRVEAAAAG